MNEIIMKKTAALRGAVEGALSRHGRGVVGFSGGKDSVALMHLLHPFKDRLEFVWANPGASLPHMEAFVQKLGVRELRSDQSAQFSRAGLPARLVPIFNTPDGLHSKLEPRYRLMLSDWVSCCKALRAAPVLDYMKREGVTLLLHGQREEDGVSLPNYSSEVETLGPLWDWTDLEVWGYLASNRLEIPEQYAQGYSDSLECWNCTAQIDPERFAYLATHYPSHWELLRFSLRKVYGAVAEELGRSNRALSMALAEETDSVHEGAGTDAAASAVGRHTNQFNGEAS